MSITIRIPKRLTQLFTTVALIALGVIAGMAVSARGAGAAIEDAAYTAVTPCAVFDSRTGTGPFAGPYQGDKSGGVFTGVNKKTLRVTGSGLTNIAGFTQGANDDCGIPPGVVAVHLNIVAINPLNSGNVVVVDEGGAPSGGIVNYNNLTPTLNNSNAHNVPVSAGGEVDVYANCGNNCQVDTVHVRGVVLGYWTNDLATRVAALEALLADVTRDNGGPNGTDRLLFTGMNLQLVDGTGDTRCDDGTSYEVCNGLGNLIIGYNEDSFSGTDRTGTHSLVVGLGNDWTAYSNVVFGENNDATSGLATITGGSSNDADGARSSISGGTGNTIFGAGIDASITGGSENFVNAPNSSITGGYRNRAVSSSFECEGPDGSALPGRQNATVTGGYGNTADGCFAAVTGGESNTASGSSTSVVGGSGNTALGDSSSISGGAGNSADGFASAVTGGSLNTAAGIYSVVSGGYLNTASTSTSATCPLFDGDPSIADWTSVTGGKQNLASGCFAVVTGGQNNDASAESAVVVGGGGSGINENVASGARSVVVGGNGNTASGTTSVVAGGSANEASGDASVVSGGSSRTASGTFDWVAGTLFETS